MPWYRIGDPGQDTVAHINFGGRQKRAANQCRAPHDPKDNPKWGKLCGRMSTKLCDGHLSDGTPCDLPICDLHSTPHPTKKDTDYCPTHKEQANAD